MLKITFNRQIAAISVLAPPDANKYSYRYAVEVKSLTSTVLEPRSAVRLKIARRYADLPHIEV